MAKIAWTAEAEQWLQDIYDYISADNPNAALRTVEAIYERTQVLSQFPEILMFGIYLDKNSLDFTG